MKWLRAWAGLGLLFTALAAQEPAAEVTPEVEILKLAWEQVFPPLALPDSFPDASRGARGLPPDMPNAPVPRWTRSYYAYTLKLRNTGTRPITGLTWEYFFLDPADDKKVMGHRKFSALKKINPAKSATIENRSLQPPTNVVTVAGLQKDKRSPFTERVVIRCILYGDGSTWKHPSASEGDCDNLRRSERRKRK